MFVYFKKKLRLFYKIVVNKLPNYLYNYMFQQLISPIKLEAVTNFYVLQNRIFCEFFLSVYNKWME